MFRMPSFRDGGKKEKPYREQGFKKAPGLLKVVSLTYNQHACTAHDRGQYTLVALYRLFWY